MGFEIGYQYCELYFTENDISAGIALLEKNLQKIRSMGFNIKTLNAHGIKGYNSWNILRGEHLPFGSTEYSDDTDRLLDRLKILRFGEVYYFLNKCFWAIQKTKPGYGLYFNECGYSPQKGDYTADFLSSLRNVPQGKVGFLVTHPGYWLKKQFHYKVIKKIFDKNYQDNSKHILEAI
jgi:hypothetical protein